MILKSYNIQPWWRPIKNISICRNIDMLPPTHLIIYIIMENQFFNIFISLTFEVPTQKYIIEQVDNIIVYITVQFLLAVIYLYEEVIFLIPWIYIMFWEKSSVRRLPLINYHHILSIFWPLRWSLNGNWTFLKYTSYIL